MLKADTMESEITQCTTGKWDKMASIVRKLCMVAVKGGAQGPATVLLMLKSIKYIN